MYIKIIKAYNKELKALEQKKDMTRIKISWAINHTFNHLVLQLKKKTSPRYKSGGKEISPGTG